MIHEHDDLHAVCSISGDFSRFVRGKNTLTEKKYISGGREKLTN